MSKFLAGARGLVKNAAQTAVQTAQQKAGQLQGGEKPGVLVDAIELELISGSGLIAADKNGFSDPYVRIYSGNHKYKSKYKTKTLDPKWNQTFYLEDTHDTIHFDVFDKDRYDKDDFLGWCEVDASELDPEAPREYELPVYVEKGSKDEIHGSILITLLKTQIPSTKLSAKGARKKYQKIAGKRRLVVELAEAKDLIASDSDGFSDPYVKFKVAKKSAKSRTVMSNLNPVWNQRFEFDVAEGQDGVLTLQVYDYDIGIANDDLIGEAEIDLSEFDSNHRHEDWYRLTLKTKGYQSVPAGWLKLGITLLEIGRPITVNTSNKVAVEIAKAINLKTDDKVFAEVKLGSSFLYTERLGGKSDPKWETIMELPLNDIYQSMVLTVYSGDIDDKKFLGRVVVPVLEMHDRQKEFYVLKNKEGTHRFGTGEIQLAFQTFYSTTSPIFHLIKRHEKVDYEAELEGQKSNVITAVRVLSKKVKLIRADGKRLSKLIGDVQRLIRPVLDVLNWKNIPLSLMWMILWVPICLLFRAWWIPAGLSCFFIYTFFAENESPKYEIDENGFFKAQFVDEMDDEDDEEFLDDEELSEMEQEEAEASKGAQKKKKKMKKNAMQTAVHYANLANRYLDFVASIGERTEALAYWSVPIITRVFLIAFIVLSLVMILVPLNLLFLFGGLGYHSFKFYKFHIKAPKTEKQKLKKPSNEVVNMMLRLPTAKQLVQHQRYQPVDETIKKSRMHPKTD